MTVTSEEFVEAKNNIDNAKILNSVAKFFRNRLTREEIQNAKTTALFQCMRRFDPTKNKKFTTFLYKEMLLTCMRQHQIKNKTINRMVEYTPNMDVFTKKQEKNEDYEHVIECMDKLSKPEKEIIQQYYLCNMTLAEIGLIGGYSKVYAHILLTKAMNKLRALCLRES